MPRSYKLRLGDGTVLAVDHGSLATWLVDRKAMVQEEGRSQWYSLHEYLAAERVAARRAARKGPSGGPLPLIPPPPKDQPIRKPDSPTTPSTREALPLIPPPPKDQPIRKLETPVTPAPPAAEEVPPPLAPAATPLVPPPPAEEPTRAWDEPRLPPPDEDVPLLAIAEAASAASPPPEATPLSVVVKVHEVKVLAEELAPRYPTSPDDSAPPIPVSPPDEPAIPDPWQPSIPGGSATRQPLGVLAEDPRGGRAGAAGSFEIPDEDPGDAQPVIRLKPSDSFDRLPAAAESRWPMKDDAGQEDPARPPVSDEEHWRQLEIEELLQKPAVAATLRALAVFGGILSQLLDRVTRLERDRRSRSAAAPSATRSPLDAVLGSAHAAAERVQQRWRSWQAERSAPPSAPPVRPAEAPDPFLAPTPAAAAPRRAPAPPPPLEALPALRLAEIEESEDLDEVFEGGAWGGTLLPALWTWTRRLVLISILVVGGTFAAVNWRSWFPKAGEIGQQTLGEIDRHARSAELAREEQRLLQEAGERLPQLRADTIRLLVSRAPGGLAPETPSLFRSACDAADKGQAALEPAEVEELQGLRTRLLAPLRPEERERVRAYDRARASGAVFDFDDRSVQALVAEGARELPPELIGRLQLLLGKAIAAGLAPPTPGAPTPGAPRSSP